MHKEFTKTILILALALNGLFSAHAQNYMITFSGSGESSVVETVEVKNTTQQTSITLNGSDTLHLVDVVGIIPLVQENAGMKVYPNPTRQTSRIEFYNAEAGNVRVEIIEITGKTLKTFIINLSRGLQAFEIQGLGTGIYLLKVTTETTVHQQRLITYAQNNGNPQINYIGSFEQGHVPVELKSTKNIVVMQYNAGERLVVKGNSGEYSHTRSFTPTGSQNIDFEFIECIDGDGNQYGVVTIGEQVWMAENLKTTQYSNGTPIEYPADSNYAWEYNTTGAYAWHENDISWKDYYGALYNWHAVMNINGLCPDGWHIPSDAEWTQLVDYAVSQGFPNDYEDPNGTGNALKSCRQVDSSLGGDCNTTDHPRWNAYGFHPSFDGFGFSAFPGGFRVNYGSFYYFGFYGYWWSSSESSSNGAWHLTMNYYYGHVSQNRYHKSIGLSVRCLRD